MRKILVAAAAAVALAVAGAAYASVTFDPVTGTGFVGKGDVQLVYGWNNAQLQANAANVQFRANSTTVTEVTWECSNLHNENVQERARTTTTTIQGVVSTIARQGPHQITGFNLNGYSGTPTSTSSTGGPAVNSCPGSPSTWFLSSPAGDPVVVDSGGGGLEVSTNGADWSPIG